MWATLGLSSRSPKQDIRKVLLSDWKADAIAQKESTPSEIPFEKMRAVILLGGQIICALVGVMVALQSQSLLVRLLNINFLQPGRLNLAGLVLLALYTITRTFDLLTCSEEHPSSAFSSNVFASHNIFL